MPHRPSRRTVLQMLGSIGTATIANSTAVSATPSCDAIRTDGTHSQTSGVSADDHPDGATRYVAVVDRIVDGEHVVLLLEDGGDLVDQHVEPKATFDEIAERDVVQVVLKDDSLLAYTHLSTRSGHSRNTRGRSIADRATTTPQNRRSTTDGVSGSF
ncbi:hypothetical protein [Natronorubrum aibiense]|uniref:hypothetical protein n=1 Tax=Natronorubrum aibiense TaxID=348826 RepID=UPI00128ED8D3|nr:hypothetical protein [Natronorubrum aibiense]